MFTALARIIKYGFQSFWRNGWLTVATLSILLLALIVFQGLVIFQEVGQVALVSLQDKIDISIYFKAETPEDDILLAKRSLEELEEVKVVEYIPRDEALAQFQERHSGDETITRSLQAVEDNPLLALLNIKAFNPREYSVIAAYLENASFSEWFNKVTYAQNALVIDRLTQIIDTAERGGLLLIIILAAVAVLVTFNTVRLAIYSSREEIGIMRLVGASNMFIRGPYMVNGVLYGIIAGILSLLITAPLIYVVTPYVNVVIPEMNLWAYFTANLSSLLLIQLTFGVVLGVISSIFAVRRYLRS